MEFTEPIKQRRPHSIARAVEVIGGLCSNAGAKPGPTLLTYGGREIALPSFFLLSQRVCCVPFRLGAGGWGNNTSPPPPPPPRKEGPSSTLFSFLLLLFLHFRRPPPPPSSSFPVSLSPGGEEKRDGRPRKRRRGPFPLSYPPKKCCSCRRRNSVSPVFFVFLFLYIHADVPVSSQEEAEGGRRKGAKKYFFVGGQWHITRIRRYCIQCALTCKWRIYPLIYNIKFCHILEGTPTSDSFLRIETCSQHPSNCYSYA